MPSKKYKLFASDNPAEKAACAFFASPAGCRNGDTCKFSHGESAPTPSQTPNKVELSDDSSVSSEESHAEMPINTPVKKEVKKENPAQNQKVEQTKKKKRKSMDDGDIFSKPKNASNGKGRDQQTPTNSNKKQKQTNTPSSTPTAKVKVEAKPKAPTSNFSSFLANLPVASFSIPGTNGATPTKKKQDADAPATTPAKKATPKKKEEQGGILPTSTAIGRKWKKTVVESRKHDRYNTSFDFKRHKENLSSSGIELPWLKAKPYGSWCESNPQAIAIDCEMCETQDPLSGAKNPKALCRLSVVNAEKPDEVLLDTLVKPVWPVIDYRTRINGIAKEHLENVEFTLRHAQAFMLALCSQETVIVGHALHNDLVALNFEHDVVADSSFLFRSKDSPAATPSLKDTVKTMLKKEMPNTHDSVNDARKSLECVLHWIQNDGKVEEVERSAKRTFQATGHQLFIHRIPKMCNEEQLSGMFLKHSYIQPIEVEDIQFSGSSGKTHVSFKSPRHANLAFETLDGKAEEEKSGRLQKKVYLRNGDYIRVRKMAHVKRTNGVKDGNKETTSSP
jgi:RNA exonuclease 1